MNVLKMKKLALAVGSLALLGASASVLAAPAQFTLSPGNISPTLFPGSVTADTLSGVSTELLTATAAGTSGSGYLLYTAATLNGVSQYAGFYSNGSPFASSQYNLYVTFQLTDTGTGAIGVQNNVTSLNFQFYIDPTHDDAFSPATAGANTSTNATITNTSNDILLAFGSLVSGVDGFDTQGGAYLNSTETFNICSAANTALNGNTPVDGSSAAAGINGGACAGNAGTQFFTAPVPFYQFVFDGFNNNGAGGNVERGSGTTGNQIAINSAVGNVAFTNVPEPGSIALLGIAAVAAGLSLRRRKAA